MTRNPRSRSVHSFRPGALLLSVALASAIFAQSNAGGSQDDQARKAWTKTLQRAFAGRTDNLAVDVDLEQRVPALPARTLMNERATVDLLAAIMRREARTIASGWALVRTRSVTDPQADDINLAQMWLAAVPEEELRRLTGEGMSFGDLSEPSRRVFASLCPNPGLQQKILAGEFVQSRVRLTVLARAVDRQGRPKTIIVDPFEFDSDHENDLLARQERAFVPPLLKGSEGKRTEGALDLSEGRLMTIAEALKVAEKALGTPFSVDRRLEPSTIYLQGRFDETTFLAALKAVTATIVVDREPRTWAELKASLAETAGRRLRKVVDESAKTKGLELKSALDREKYDGKTLAKLIPGWDRAMELNGIDPNSTFTLLPGLSLSLSGSGSYSDPDYPKESPVANKWSTIFSP